MPTITTHQRHDALQILRHNHGFTQPERWVDVAVEYAFKPVKARAVPRCPECGGEGRDRIGRYIYFSTLIHLRRCERCELIWADAQVDPALTRAHYDPAYEDRDYFATRAAVFGHLVDRISRVTPRNGVVLDVGGAQGDLMHLLRERRPDITPVVHDLSPTATAYAAERFGLRTLCGDFSVLGADGVRYDTVVLSDVLYYEPDLPGFWRTLMRLVKPGGAAVIRVPNKLLLTRAAGRTGWLRALLGRRDEQLAGFNPEHLYILHRGYLERRLRRAGFRHVEVLPSPWRTRPSAPARFAARGLFAIAAAASRLSAGRLLLTPSMVFVATR